jgi:SAM-dependent methyltransferase
MNPEHGLFKCLRCGSRSLALAGNEYVCGSCGGEYPIVRGIPRFVDADNYATSFGYQWNIHARTQLDSHTGLPISRSRLFGVSGWSHDLRGQTVLEAGSGAGRFTEVLLSTGADVYSFDFSSAVEANHRNNGDKPNLKLFQGDIFNIPLEEGAFDKVMCLGVLQHTPDPERAFHSLTRFVKPGGALAIDVYTRGFAAALQWKYLLRPITKRIPAQRLYGALERLVPKLIPAARFLRRHGGRAGARLVPIIEYSHIGLGDELNAQWAVLDTFDMYSPAHDHPKSIADVTRWFSDAGFENVHVGRGQNGVIGRGTRRA